MKNIIKSFLMLALVLTLASSITLVPSSNNIGEDMVTIQDTSWWGWAIEMD